MGQGYSYKCEKCGYTLEYLQGVGFMFIFEAEEILKEMLNGKYGKRFMELSTQADNPQAEHSKELYKCTGCGELRPSMEVKLYDGNKLLLEKQHRCGKCRKPMVVVSKKEKLLCPKCHTPLSIGDFLMWD